MLKLGYFNSRNQFSSIFKNYCWLLKDMFIGWLKVILQRLFPFLINFVVKISWNIKVAFSRKTPLSYISTPLFDVSFGLFRIWNRWYIRVWLFHFIQWRDQFFKHFLMYILFPIWFVFIYSLNYYFWFLRIGKMKIGSNKCNNIYFLLIQSIYYLAAHL